MVFHLRRNYGHALVLTADGVNIYLEVWNEPNFTGQKELLLKWDGAYPRYFMGAGAGNNPNLLLQLPQLQEEKGK